MSIPDPTGLQLPPLCSHGPSISSVILWITSPLLGDPPPLLLVSLRGSSATARPLAPPQPAPRSHLIGAFGRGAGAG